VTARPYLKIADRDFLRAVAAGRVHRSLSGLPMQRGGAHGGQNKRADGLLARAKEAGRVEEWEPGRFRLTPDGEADLAARENAGAVR
jgi:hypothetical protein